MLAPFRLVGSQTESQATDLQSFAGAEQAHPVNGPDPLQALSATYRALFNRIQMRTGTCYVM